MKTSNIMFWYSFVVKSVSLGMRSFFWIFHLRESLYREKMANTAKMVHSIFITRRI